MSLQSLETNYAGTNKRLFWLALKTSVLTVLTLGFYRFWMKTRLRRFYWSSIRPGGVPLEYTGTGVEKLMGFLIAVVFLAFYIGLFNLLLMFFSFALLNDSFAAYFMSFIGVIPIYFYAQYRARRNILARTRWRGVRFGIDPAAWGYAWRAMLHWLLTIVTLGFMLPRQIFWLEKFRIDRTWFGRARFVQEGRWQDLVRPARHYYIGLVITIVSGFAGYFEELMLLGLIPGVIWLGVGYLHLSIKSYRVLASGKRLGEGITFDASPRTGRVLGIYVGGGLLAQLCVGLLALGAFILFAAIAGILSPDFFDGLENGNVMQEIPLLMIFAVAYFSIFIFWGAFMQIFVTMPLMRHYAQTIRIHNFHRLSEVRQRARDEMAEAEGFADALDIGAAI